MEIQEIIQPIMLRLPMYAYSHIYDVVVYEIGILVAVLICFIKDPFKRLNRKGVYHKTGIDVKAKRDQEEENSSPVKAAVMMYRRRNMFIALAAGIVSEILFLIFAYYSPRIKGITWWNVIAFLTPIAVYTFAEVLTGHWTGPIICVAVTVCVAFANRYYCMINESHHKMCYVIKFMMLLFGVTGILLQFFVRKKYNKPIKEEKADSLD